jgi:hypothetical protein
MKVLLDMNVVLDVLLVRQPWFPEASQIWDANRNGQIAAGIAAFTVPTVFYIVRRQTDLRHAQAQADPRRRSVRSAAGKGQGEYRGDGEGNLCGCRVSTGLLESHRVATFLATHHLL